MIHFLLFFGCSTLACPTSYNSNLLIGHWRYEVGSPRDNTGIWTAIGEYKSNGELIGTVHGSLKSENKKATFIYEAKSSWRIECDNYIEEIKDIKFISLEGDSELKKILKEIILSDIGETSSGKILKLNDDVFIAVEKLNNNSENKMILHKIK